MNLSDIKVGETYRFRHQDGESVQPDENVKVVAIQEDDPTLAFANSVLFPGEHVIEVIGEDGEEGLVFATELSPVTE